MSTYTHTDGSAVMSAVGRVMEDDARLAFRSLHSAIVVECPERIRLQSPHSDRHNWGIALPSGGVAMIQTSLLEAVGDLSLSIEVDADRTDAAVKLYRRILDRVEVILAPELRLRVIPRTPRDEEVDDLPF